MESKKQEEIFALTESNYFSKEADMKYVSASQYKSFCGSVGKRGCEAAALAELRGEFERPMTTPLMVGSYVDAYFEGTLPTFIAQHPDIVSTRGATAGQLKAEYKQAEAMIERATKDPFFMQFMNGDKQVIMTGEIEGVPVKIKIDVAHKNLLVDLKTVKDVFETFYVKDSGERVSFAEWWSYDIQGAIYREIYRQNTGDLLPFYICAISKNKTDNVPHPRLAVIQIPDQIMDERLIEVKANINRIQDLKSGMYDPIPCGVCDYCADTLPLENVLAWDELTMREI